MVIESYSTVSGAERLREQLVADGCHIISEEYGVHLDKFNCLGDRIRVRRYSARELAYARSLGDVDGEKWLLSLEEM